MAGGNLIVRSSNFYEPENDDSKSIETNFVDAREKPEGTNPINNSSVP